MKHFNLRTATRTLLATTVLLPTAAAFAESPIVVEREGADQVRAGERYEYKLKVSNQSDQPVRDIEINEFTQDGSEKTDTKKQKPGDAAHSESDMQGKSDTDMQGKSDKSSSISKTIPSLAPGQSKTLTVSGIARKEGTVQSCMTVDYKPALCSDIKVVKPDISLKCDMADPEKQVTMENGSDQSLVSLYACDAAMVRCTVTNEGSAKTKAAKLNLNLPDGVSSDKSGMVEVPAIDPGDSKEIMFNLRADKAGSYTVTPNMKLAEGNAEAEAIKVRFVEPELELAIQSPSKAFVSRTIDYTINLRNVGDAPVSDARLSIQAPDQLENVSISSENAANGEDQYDFGDLAPGASRSVTVSGDAVDAGEATLIATADAYCLTDDKALEKQAAVTTEGVPALVVFAYDREDPVTVGNDTSYEIKIKNQGTAPAESIELSGTLSNELKFKSGNGESKVTAEGNNLKFASIDALEPGEVATWTINATAGSEGYARLDLDVKSSATKRAVTEQEPTRIIKK